MSIPIEEISDTSEFKKKVVEEVESGSDPNEILKKVFENQNISRGNKLKIGRYLVLKGADRAILINNDSARGRGKKSKKIIRRSSKRTRSKRTRRRR